MMRLHNILPAAVVLLLCTCTTSAAERMKVGFMLDVANGVSMPVADDDYKNFADPSYKLAIRAGAVLYVLPRLGIAPEAEFSFVPVNSNDRTFQNNSIDAQFYRERGLVGARFIVPFGFGSVYARVALGVDHIGGTTSITVGGLSVSTNWGSTGFTFEPDVGVQFNVHKHLVVGVSTGFPIAAHNFGSGKNPSKFTAVDVDFLAVFGVRL
jgi:hypothetical protein